MAGDFLGTYDFKKVILIVGTRALKGFEDGTEITVSRDEESFTKKVGNDGNITRSRSNNDSGSVTFTLNQFSSDNRYLKDLSLLDEASGNGVVPLKLVDKSDPNGSLVLAGSAWIQKPADQVFGEESGAREWVIDCANLKIA